MKTQFAEICLLFIMASLCASSVGAQAFDTLWTETFGDTAYDEAYSVHATTDGGCIVAGRTRSFGAGNDDVYVIKTDSLGGSTWAKEYGYAGWEMGYCVRKTSDGGYVVVGHTWPFGDSLAIYLIKLGENGDTLWTRTYGGDGHSIGASVDETIDGGYIIGGLTGSPFTGSMSALLMKTNSQGDSLWAKTYGSTGMSGVDCVQQTSDSGFILGGGIDTIGSNIWLIKTDSLGDTLWTKMYGGAQGEQGHFVQQTSDGGFILIGSTKSFSPPGGSNIWLLKTDSMGDTLWTRIYGGDGNDEGLCVDQTSDGGFWVTGTIDPDGPDSGDVFVMRTNSTGAAVWTQVYGGQQYDKGESVEETLDGGCIIAGGTQSYGVGNMDVYLIRIAPTPGIGGDSPNGQDSFFVSDAQPNPFTDHVVFRFVLPKRRAVDGGIYNFLGQQVKTLIHGVQDAGLHTIIWNATDNSGRKVPSGTYFLRLETADYTATKKLSVIR